jgi:hypothetical protein
VYWRIGKRRNRCVLSGPLCIGQGGGVKSMSPGVSVSARRVQTIHNQWHLKHTGGVCRGRNPWWKRLDARPRKAESRANAGYRGRADFETCFNGANQIRVKQRERLQLPKAPELAWAQPMALPYPTLVPRGKERRGRREGGQGEQRIDEGGWEEVEERQREHAGELQASVLDRIDRQTAAQVAKLRR